MAEVVKAENVEASLDAADGSKVSYDHHHHGNEKLMKLDQHMKKYDTDGDGVFSPDEVRNIVRDMEEAEKSAKNMGRLAGAVAIAGICLCGALLGLMYAANEAAKENHTKGGVLKDLNGDAVSGATLKSYASMFEFPKLPHTTLNEIGFVAFSAKDGTDTIDMRYQISSWTRSQGTKDTKLIANDGSVITIIGDGSQAHVKRGDDTYEIIKPATRRRRLTTRHAKLFSSVKEMNHHFHAHAGGRRLMDEGDEPAVAIENTLPFEYEPYPDKCYYQESDECMCLWDPSYCPGFDFGSAPDYSWDFFSYDYNYGSYGSGDGDGSGGMRRLNHDGYMSGYYYFGSGDGDGTGTGSGSGATYESCNNEFNKWWDSLSTQDYADCGFYVYEEEEDDEDDDIATRAANIEDCSVCMPCVRDLMDINCDLNSFEPSYECEPCGDTCAGMLLNLETCSLTEFGQSKSDVLHGSSVGSSVGSSAGSNVGSSVGSG